MKNHEFDKEVRLKAEEESNSFDMEAMWTSVEPQLHVKKDKRRYFIWLFSGLFFLSLIALTGWRITLSEASKTNDFQLTKTTTSSDVVESKEVDQNNLNEEVSSEHNSEEQTLDTNHSIEQSTRKGNDLVIVEKEVSYNTAIDSESTQVKKDQKVVGSSDRKLKDVVNKSMELSMSKSISPDDKLNHSNLLTEEEDSKVTLSSAKKTIEEVNISEKTISSVSDLSKSRKLKKSHMSEMEQSDERELLADLTFAPYLVLKQVNYSRNLLSDQEVTFSHDEVKATYPSYLGISFAYSKIANSMRLQDGGDPLVFALRNGQEKPLDVLAFGIDFTKYYTANWGFDASLTYEKQFHSRNAITVSMGQLLLEDYVVSRQISANGVIEQKEDILVNNTTRFSEQTYLRFTQFGLKLGLRYSKQFGQWNFGATTGLEPQVLMSRSGWISQDVSKYDINKDVDNIFNTGLQLNTYGSLFASYPITNRIFMDLHFNLSMPLRNRYSDTYSIQERNALYGLRAAFKINI